MDSRGYGRRTDVSSTSRRVATTATVGGLLVTAIGLYGVASAGSVGGLGLPLVAVGVVASGAGLAVSGRRNTRSRYRPDPWRRPEWLVVASGLAALASISIANALNVAGLTVSFHPLALPDIPILPIVGILIAITPAFVVPKPPPTNTDQAPATNTAAPTRQRQSVPA
jgi:energy-coupling factor transport system permease protein